MIKKLISNLVLILLIFISSFFIILSTIGIETDKFNQLISKKIGQTKNIELERNSKLVKNNSWTL